MYHLHSSNINTSPSTSSCNDHQFFPHEMYHDETVIHSRPEEHSSPKIIATTFAKDSSCDSKSKASLFHGSSFRTSLMPLANNGHSSVGLCHSQQRVTSDSPFPLGHNHVKKCSTNQVNPGYASPLWINKEVGSNVPGPCHFKLSNSANHIFKEELESIYRYARERGYIVGEQLEQVLQRSSRSCMSNNNKVILNQFKTRYGEVDSKTRSSYIQLGVRVPSKDHVSEIVGKGGTKIKFLREESGALITTPGEQDDHVFIIEAPPSIAFNTAECIQRRSDEITQNKALDRRKSYFSFTNGTNVTGGHFIPGCNGNNNLPLPSGNATDIGNGGYGCGNVAVPHRRLLTRDRIAVPQDMVGKIIGTAGSIVTTIQRDTGTEIRSPPKDVSRDCAEFEISIYEQTGVTLSSAKERILRAKQLIAHLVMRQYEKLEQTSFLDGVSQAYGASNSNNEMCCNGTEEHGKNIMEHKMTRPNSSSNMLHWRWPDLQPMNVDEAREVIDRILMESKSKVARRGSSPDLLPDSYISGNQSSQYPSSETSISTYSTPGVYQSSFRTWNTTGTSKQSQQNGFRDDYRLNGFPSIQANDIQVDNSMDKLEYSHRYLSSKGPASTSNNHLIDYNHLKPFGVPDNHSSYISDNKSNKAYEVVHHQYGPSPGYSSTQESNMHGKYCNGAILTENMFVQQPNVWRPEFNQQTLQYQQQQQLMRQNIRDPNENGNFNGIGNLNYNLTKYPFPSASRNQINDEDEVLSLAGLSLNEQSRHLNLNNNTSFPDVYMDGSMAFLDNSYHSLHDVLACSNDSGFESLPGAVDFSIATIPNKVTLETMGVLGGTANVTADLKNIDISAQPNLYENIWQTDCHTLSSSGNVGIIGDRRKKTPSPPFS